MTTSRMIGSTMVPAITRPAVIKATIVTSMRVIRDVVSLVLDLITGKWGKAWGDVKHLVSDSLHGVLSIMGALLGLMGKAAARIGTAIWDGIVGALRELTERLARYPTDDAAHRQVLGGGSVGCPVGDGFPGPLRHPARRGLAVDHPAV